MTCTRTALFHIRPFTRQATVSRTYSCLPHLTTVLAPFWHTPTRSSSTVQSAKRTSGHVNSPHAATSTRLPITDTYLTNFGSILVCVCVCVCVAFYRLCSRVCYLQHWDNGGKKTEAVVTNRLDTQTAKCVSTKGASGNFSSASQPKRLTFSEFFVSYRIRYPSNKQTNNTLTF
jgi:hypothetical protein